MSQKSELIGGPAFSPKFVGQSDFVYVPMIVFNQVISAGLFGKKKVTVPTQLMSNNGFRTDKEAISFIPLFISEKMKTGDLPKELVLKDENGNQFLDESVCQAGYLKVKLSVLELEDNGDSD